MNRIFLLSPAYCGGKRASWLGKAQPGFELARRLQAGDGDATLGEVFCLFERPYFRGKLAYARRFARPPQGQEGIMVITPNRGLQPAHLPVNLADIQMFAEVDVAADDERYRRPLERDIEQLAANCRSRCEFVLLGSIATGKYVDVLLEAVGDRLFFPPDFVGRGDMSRGGLLLRAADSGQELPYAPVAGARRHGSRPPKLEPRAPGASLRGWGD